jgi:hypothetical protein
MIFELQVGLQIVEGKIERRDVSKWSMYGEASGHSVMDRAFATNVRREQNVKTYEKISRTCLNNRYEARRTRDISNVFLTFVSSSECFCLGGTGDGANTLNLPDRLTIPPLSVWMLNFNDITRRHHQSRERRRRRKRGPRSSHDIQKPNCVQSVNRT